MDALNLLSGVRHVYSESNLVLLNVIIISHVPTLHTL